MNSQLPEIETIKENLDKTYKKTPWRCV